MDKKEIIRKHYRLTGYVQGVGFRYRARHAADSLGLSGYARNCYDGSVEMELEGAEELIDEAVIMILRGPFIEVDQMDVKKVPVKNDRGFFTE